MNRITTLLTSIAILLLGCGDEKSSRTQSTGLPIAAPMRGTGELQQHEQAAPFTFVVFGDNRPGMGEPQPETIKEIFAEIKDLQPAFAISLGDIIQGEPQPGDPSAIQTIRRQFDDFLVLAKAADTPIFNAPGNHEMDDDQDIPTRRMHALYQEHVGPTHGAFNYGDSRFILLNCEDVTEKNTPPPPNGEEFSYISPQQLADLKADLESNRHKKHIVIAMHYPVFARSEGPPKSDWDDRLTPESRESLLKILKDFSNIAYVLAAHEHLYYNPQSPEDITKVPGWKAGDPIRFLISGGAGAPLNVGKWGFHHYLVFTVDGDQISARLVKLQSKGASS